MEITPEIRQRIISDYMAGLAKRRQTKVGFAVNGCATSAGSMKNPKKGFGTTGSEKAREAVRKRWDRYYAAKIAAANEGKEEST